MVVLKSFEMLQRCGHPGEGNCPGKTWLKEEDAKETLLVNGSDKLPMRGRTGTPGNRLQWPWEPGA